MSDSVKHIVNFSGGKDSTAMLLRMLEENMQVDEIIFCNVKATQQIGGELPEMYDYVNKINNYIKQKYLSFFKYYYIISKRRDKNVIISC